MNASFLDQLAQARPDPGGGAAAAYSAGVGLALLTKIIRLEKSRPYNDESQGKFWAEQLAETRRLTRIFQQLRQVDVEAYLTMAEALSVRQQGAALQRAVEEATRCPWQIMEQALVALDLVAAAGAHCRRHLLSDLLVATELLGGALQGAYHIAAANLSLIKAANRRKEWVGRLSQASHQGLEATLRVRSQLVAKVHAGTQLRMIIAADNLTGADPVVAQALRSLDPAPLQDLARRCEAAGAQILDLNPGYLSRRLEDRMAFLVEAVQEVTILPLILDSPNPRVLAGGLGVSREKPILNAVTLEEHKLEEILPLAAMHGARVVLLLLDDKSHSPPSLEGKIALAVELRERALAAGLTDEQLIFDPVLPNLRWPDAWPQTGAAFKTMRYLASGSLFGVPVSTMVGLSNLRSGLRGIYPVELEITVLALLAGAGLGLALVDVLNPVLREQLQLMVQVMGTS